MPLNPQALREVVLPPQETVLTDRDAMFYALSIGLGVDPLDSQELPYVYERELKVFPTMPLIVGHPGNWQVENPQTGITRSMVVHGTQRLWVHAPLPIGRPIVTTNRIDGVYDKGDRGAVIVVIRETVDKASGALIARGESGVFCRADGGFGGENGPPYEFAPTPERTPDRSIDIETREDLALWYRLNHDRNPLHADPEVAAKAGFKRPILHGLCTYGMTAVAATRASGGRSIASIEARFSKPVTPGETITVDLWEDGEGYAFRARVAARDAVVLDRGRLQFA
jgi:acyl dehydratase